MLRYIVLPPPTGEGAEEDAQGGVGAQQQQHDSAQSRLLWGQRASAHSSVVMVEIRPSTSDFPAAQKIQ